jgi:hypothetical protein
MAKIRGKIRGKIQIWLRNLLPLLVVIVMIVFIVVFIVVFIDIVYLWLKDSYLLCKVSKVAQIIAYTGPFIIGMAALSTYWQNSSLKRMEFIDQVYKEFDDIADLYDLLIANPKLNIEHNSPEPESQDNENALINALTLFDKILNYYEQNLINNETLSYIAAEVLDFYQHIGVEQYITNIHNIYEYDNKRYIDDIRFYSGLGELGKICSKQFISPKNKFKRFWWHIF